MSAGIGIFVKYASRNDNHQGFVKEDLAIGLDLFVTAIIFLITTSVDSFVKIYKSNDIAPIENIESVKNLFSILPWLILLMVFSLWTTSTVVRKRGWLTKDSLHIGYGIVLPNTVGLLALIFVFFIIKG